MTMISDLPGDLVEEILCRVPAISLKRLRYSCKHWNRLFNDKRFARKHLDKAAKQSLVFTVTKDFRICLMSVNLHGTPSLEFKGELSLPDWHSNSNQDRISKVFHCQGLLLRTTTINNDTRIVLWNPCTGKTRWIQPIHTCHNYALGSYQESRSGNSSYKILSYGTYVEFAIYELNSNSWRVLDVTPDFRLLYVDTCVSLKGKTYWFASDSKDEQLGMFLVSFDYTTERFGRLCLPCKCPIPSFKGMALSVVSEEKLSVLLLHKNTWGKEIWVSDKIDGDNEVSWRKFLTVNHYPEREIWLKLSCFLVDEEKKAALCCGIFRFDHIINIENLVCVTGEDNEVKLLDFGAFMFESSWPVLDYVPSLTYIQSS